MRIQLLYGFFIAAFLHLPIPLGVVELGHIVLRRYGYMCDECKRTIVVSDQAPKAIGPYSAGVIAGRLVYTAGQLGIDPATGDIVPGGVQEETRQALKNLSAILEAAGSNLASVVKIAASSLSLSGDCPSKRRCS